MFRAPFQALFRQRSRAARNTIGRPCSEISAATAGRAISSSTDGNSRSRAAAAPETRTFFGFVVFFIVRPPEPRAPDAYRDLVPEVVNARRDHRKAQLVRDGDHFVVAHRAARLNHRGSASLRGFFHAIGKREKRVRRE